MSGPKVVIAGAGALGLSCADHLTQRGVTDVTVLDIGNAGGGSTGLSAGVFTRQYADPQEIELRVRAERQLTALSESDGLELTRVGFLRLARDEATLEGYRQSAAAQAEFGVTDTTVVDTSGVAKIVPDVSRDGVVGGLYNKSDGYMDGVQLCNVLAERVQARGGTITVRSGLAGVRSGTSQRYVVTTTTGEEIPADIVVNAAGAWAGRVGDALGAPVEVINERHEAFSFKLPPGLDYKFPQVMDYVIGSGRSGVYFRNEGEDQLVGGLHTNEIHGERVENPDDYFRGVNQESVDEIVALLAELLPLEGVRYAGGWAGIYPQHPALHPVLGPHPDDDGIIVGAGLGGVGLSTSPALGEILADWITDGEPRGLPWAVRYSPAALTNDQ